MPPRHLRDTAGDPAAVAQLRRRRASFAEIAAHLGITQDQAAELYRQVLETLPEFKAAEFRAEELVLADDAMRRLMTIATGERRAKCSSCGASGTSPRTAVEAWNSVRGWAEHKARLLGLDGRQQAGTGTPGKLAQLRDARRA